MKPLFLLLALIASPFLFADEPIKAVEQKLSLSLEEMPDRESNRRYWNLTVKGPETCPCSRCTFENELTQNKNEFRLTVGKVVPPLDCLEPAQVPELTVKLSLEEREYFLQINSDRYRLQVTQDFAELRPLQAKLTRPVKKIVYRPVPRLFSLLCFRYRYPCEQGKKTPDELCPRLTANLEKLAQKADEKELVKKGLTLDCTEEYRSKGQCHLYHFDGSRQDLRTAIKNSDEYRLKKGHNAECDPTHPPLYYRKIKFWDGEEICC